MGELALDEVEITEIEELGADRIDGVGKGANGFPHLLLKGLPPEAAKADDDGKVDCPTCKGDGKIMGDKRDCPDCGATGQVTPDKAKSITSKSAAAIVKAVVDGAVDQDPDIDLGHQIMGLLAQAIIGEAQEIKAGSYGETCDVDLLNSAASMINAWLGHEEAPGPADASMGVLMDSAAIKAIVAEAVADELAKADLSGKAINDLPDSAFAHIEPGGTKDDEDKTTPRSLRHFPVHDKAHADNAAARIAQGAEFGDKAKPAVLAAQKKFGSNSDGASKGAVAEGGTAVDTDAQGTGDLAKVVEDAVTKATAPLKERIATLDGELAKVKATPVPGGPVMSVTRAHRAEAGEDWAAKAAYYEQMAATVASPSDADGYRQLAAQAKAKISAPAQ